MLSSALSTRIGAGGGSAAASITWDLPDTPGGEHLRVYVVTASGSVVTATLFSGAGGTGSSTAGTLNAGLALTGGALYAFDLIGVRGGSIQLASGTGNLSLALASVMQGGR